MQRALAKPVWRNEWRAIGLPSVRARWLLVELAFVLGTAVGLTEMNSEIHCLIFQQPSFLMV